MQASIKRTTWYFACSFRKPRIRLQIRQNDLHWLVNRTATVAGSIALVVPGSDCPMFVFNQEVE